MILECRNGREHYQFDLQSTDSFHCSKVGITKIIKSRRNSLPLWELIFWFPFLFSMSFGYLPMILISEWFIIFSLFLVQKSCRNLKRGRYGRLGLFDEKLISWRKTYSSSPCTVVWKRGKGIQDGWSASNSGLLILIYIWKPQRKESDAKKVLSRVWDREAYSSSPCMSTYDLNFRVIHFFFFVSFSERLLHIEEI